MKKIWLLLSLALCVGCTTKLSAQTFAEFFKQKQTQKKYLLQQVAALEAYTQLAKKGYAIVGSGLRLIGAIKSGKCSLDKEYFDGLNSAEDMAKLTDKPAACQRLQVAIKQIYTNAQNALLSSYINLEEKKYIQLV
ncbi:hypothetical protein [Arachidicoccus sp.]|uniref:hypothetical protein n=1 Tax=Arachidicoccus sp. TaxID=1872624 RepID=UPI003D1F34FD